jgi:hypothetical protein
MRRWALMTLICASLCSGCAVHQAHKDQDLIRTTLLDLYTHQIMDNLIRTANGLPIIQLQYTTAQAAVTITGTIGGSDSQAATVSNVLALPAASLSATRTIVTTLLGSMSGTNQNQVVLAATPVTTSNEVYDAYLSYLSKPDSLIVSCDPPAKGTYHLCRKYEGNYYWIPLWRRPDFFRLSLVTTAQRGKSLAPPDAYYEVAVQGVVEERPGAVQPPGVPQSAKVFVVKLNKTIPNDSGYLWFVDDKGNEKDGIKYMVLPYQKTQFTLTEDSFKRLKTEENVPDAVLNALMRLKDQVFVDRDDAKLAIGRVLGPVNANQYVAVILDKAAQKNQFFSESQFAVISVPLERLDEKLEPIPGEGGKPDGIKVFMASMPGKARISLTHKPPQGPTTEDLLDKVNFQLQQIQLNQLRGAVSP